MTTRWRERADRLIDVIDNRDEREQAWDAIATFAAEVATPPPLNQAFPATLSESGGAGPTLQSKGSNR